ncbi:trafficking protein particle complex subunit 6b-like [Corticium candelabrum]|uniref:trafficking protein particle complex subunit 6b-like n=1 Tax=Corticium candelabrum TaxID=121492 RepID=UPI002E262F39|nr:trafficking protein particle complex subunit 6b-like [Corticium candelabrum]
MADVPDVGFELLHAEVVRILKEGVVNRSNTEMKLKLEELGYRVGQGWIEKCTKDRAPFRDDLDVMKFVCKEFWMSIYNKQVDNLRTNHQGVFVLQDNTFHFLGRVSSSVQHTEESQMYLAFPGGMLKGALAAIGVNCSVGYEITSMPACKFTITVQPS